MAGIADSAEETVAADYKPRSIAVFGSVIAFWAYLTLIARIGADRAGYANLAFPLVALLISTLMEGYEWSLPALLGMATVVVGNWLVMRASKAQVPGSM